MSALRLLRHQFISVSLLTFVFSPLRCQSRSRKPFDLQTLFAVILLGRATPPTRRPAHIQLSIPSSRPSVAKLIRALAHFIQIYAAYPPNAHPDLTSYLPRFALIRPIRHRDVLPPPGPLFLHHGPPFQPYPCLLPARSRVRVLCAAAPITTTRHDAQRPSRRSTRPNMGLSTSFPE